MKCASLAASPQKKCYHDRTAELASDHVKLRQGRRKGWLSFPPLSACFVKHHTCGIVTMSYPLLRLQGRLRRDRGILYLVGAVVEIACTPELSPYVERRTKRTDLGPSSTASHSSASMPSSLFVSADARPMSGDVRHDFHSALSNLS